ncbi:MAG: tRNA (adenosine(37)-N6)-dimethylallyltransferase MiaA [Treponema sp.]|nr:tRNA (adenosine(37)-N6)-dimethylallyltransferase MiaA [Treponema sp.]
MKKNSSSKIPVIVIFAPTASGKTALTRELFSVSGSHFILNAEIISADSMQVYKKMDIGTAKPDQAFCSIIPHHLINLVDPQVQFNVSDFLVKADAACREIYSRGKIPVVCGGTGFYIRSFLYGLPETPESDSKIRNELKKRIVEQGNEVLYEELKKVDPESAAVINVNDAYRICRALEVYYMTGKTRSSFKIQAKLREDFDFLFLVLEPERENLYERIKKRVDLMFEAGLEKEVRNLISLGYSKDCPGMKAIGYSEWFESENVEEIRQMIKHHSCKYAKKQYTYIKDIPGSIRIPFSARDEDLEEVAQVIRNFFTDK